MTEPFVSFISTAYNTEQYVPQMIESVLAQTDPDWELVIVDNGRVESMAETINRYTGDPRVRLVRQENRGVIGGFAAAAAAATGLHVAVLSSDDELVPTYVARMREVVNHHPEAVAVACDAHLFSDQHEASYRRGHAQSMSSRPARGSGEWYSKRDLLAGRLPYYGGVYRRCVWNDVGGYSTQDDTVDENIDLLYKVLKCGPIYVIPDRLCRYRLREDSVTRNAHSVEAFERRVIHSYKVFSEQALPEERALARRTARRMMYMQSLRRARDAFVRGERELALQESKEAWRHSRTLRAGTIVALLHLAPGLLRMLHPFKSRVGDWMMIHSPLNVLRRPWARSHSDGRDPSRHRLTWWRSTTNRFAHSDRP